MEILPEIAQTLDLVAQSDRQENRAHFYLLQTSLEQQPWIRRCNVDRARQMIRFVQDIQSRRPRCQSIVRAK
jgi:hypothetical protein